MDRGRRPECPASPAAFREGRHFRHYRKRKGPGWRRAGRTAAAGRNKPPSCGEPRQRGHRPPRGTGRTEVDAPRAAQNSAQPWATVKMPATASGCGRSRDLRHGAGKVLVTSRHAKRPGRHRDQFEARRAAHRLQRLHHVLANDQREGAGARRPGSARPAACNRAARRPANRSSP